ncbi:MAG: Glucose-1-phosphate thymidylyltransferase [candidate division TA06 bacterium ADurb.Bin417]|uniref:Glucose-1-phosphate thymidylyltransferase n=1 Tax=candidate division TA06 bacterium ADurb.Bin417 TaxID=1852828 RepID=A0A1V5MA31_UNCT6|nr:MAG: Glucose-1-phosphate thymidylyltransferase [candidate division TA06 bacterium ADurb.Bin417]
MPDDFLSRPLKCVVLCAGRGTRLARPEYPKSMVEVAGRPLVDHLVQFWNQYTRDFIFVVGYQKERIISFVEKAPIRAAFVEQKELRGIGYALSLVENLVAEKFIVVLGDCLCRGVFDFPAGMEQGVGVWRTANPADIQRSYSIEVKGGLVSRVVEKPKDLVNDLCGLGFYFLDRKVFEYIRRTPPSPLRNEVEITDVIENMIRSGEPVSPVFLAGNYINITYPDDLERAAAFLRTPPAHR